MSIVAFLYTNIFSRIVLASIATVLIISIGFQFKNNIENKKIVNVDEENIIDDNILTDKKIEKGIVNINIMGDIMMGRDTEKAIENDYITPFKEIAPLMNKSDINIANLETPIYEPKQERWGRISAKKNIVNAFNILNLNIVNLANDNIVGYGKEGIDSTKEILDMKGIKYTGLDNGVATIEKNSTKIGIIGFNDIFPQNKTVYDSLGVNKIEEANLEIKIKEAKKQVDVLIVSVHWGREGSSKVTDQMRSLARKVIEYGADGVVGHGTGKLMIFETYNNKPILYGTGYFISDTLNMSSKDSGIFQFVVDKGVIKETNFIPTIIKDKKKVELAKDADKSRIIKYMNENSLRFGTVSEVLDDKIKIKY